MLRLKNIVKTYKVADTEVRALKGINLCFRKNEFVSVLGPSGCGKTTTLNIIGGLDQYTSGDLFIDGVSTKNFKDREWDVYRNHKIGFVFQSYNLIPHQTVLGNVELALTIAGVGKKERQARAKKALDKVGLKGQYNKRPNQLSGGQCQRVAIARALVNEPSILLADEPTGALDTATSVQIMDLIREIAKERLVIMVTHNPDLARQYSTRIVRLLDGELQEDSHPFSEEEEIEEVRLTKEKQKTDEPTIADEGERGKRKPKKDRAKMSLWTTFKLSGKNLWSKLKRTVMVAIAGCIGITGIASVLSVSNGVQGYIDSMENDMLSGNPVYIASSALDYSALTGSSGQKVVNPNNETNEIFINSLVEKYYNRSSATKTNTITEEYMDYLAEMPEEACALVKYEYGYRIATNVYTDFRTNDGITHRMSVAAIQAVYGSVMKNLENMSSYQSMVTSATVMSELPSDAAYLAEQYDILYIENGKTLEDIFADKGALVAVASQSHNTLNDLELAEYGYFTQEQFLNYCYKISGDERYIDSPLLNLPETMSYETLAEKTFTWYPNDTVYKQGTSEDDLGDKYYASAYADGSLAGDDTYGRNAFGNVDGAVDMRVKCVLKLKEDLSYGSLSSGGLYYTQSLSEHIRAIDLHSDICESARKSGSLNNVELGYIFKADAASDATVETYYLGSGSDGSIASYISSFFGGSSSIKSLTTYSLSALGGEEYPSSISFYCKDFAQKDRLTAYLDAWNDTVAANVYKRDESGYYLSKNGNQTEYYYYDVNSQKYYKVELNADGYVIDNDKGDMYKLFIDETSGESGFYKRLSDSVGKPFKIDEAVKINDSISINAYSVLSYVLLEEEMQTTNQYYKNLEAVLPIVEGDEEASILYRYANAKGEYKYVMKIRNQSYYKLALDKDGNILATQSGYDRYRYDQETNTFYQDEYIEEEVEIGEEKQTVYKIKSTALSESEVKQLYADETRYDYLNVVKNPVYTFNDTDYTFDTCGLYVDMTSVGDIDFTQIVVDQDAKTIKLKDYSGIDFYYKDESDTDYTYYYVNYEEKDGQRFLLGNNLSAYLDSSSLSSYNVSGYLSDVYLLNEDGSMQAVSDSFSDSALLLSQLLSLGIVNDSPLEDLSLLEKDESLKITYTDNIGLIVTMVNTLIKVVTYALIAFTALSLLVSTVMIGIITYVSVVERTKEIGVIRALGGRKRDVSNLFNAETFIIGLGAGLLGIGLTYLLSLIINLTVGAYIGVATLATLPFYQAAIMVALSVTLTLLSGIIPSRSAARKDPVVALRTE